jgi:hypothetical protein
MKAVFQSDRGNPQRTEAGDCFRACVASILERPLDTVPHFFRGQRVGTVISPQRETAMQDWFGLLGFGFVTMPLWADTPEQALATFGSRYPNLHYILIGQTRKGVNHAIVCRGTYIAHDPACPAIGLAGPQSNGVFTVGIIAFSEWN